VSRADALPWNMLNVSMPSRPRVEMFVKPDPSEAPHASLSDLLETSGQIGFRIGHAQATPPFDNNAIKDREARVAEMHVQQKRSIVHTPVLAQK
jgi:hypothetical protein